MALLTHYFDRISFREMLETDSCNFIMFVNELSVFLNVTLQILRIFKKAERTKSNLVR